jgi:alpha-L-fucosidase
MNRVSGVFHLLLSVVLGSGLCAGPALGETVEERDARMKWWREARFGMFVHWGLYSIPAGEWEGRRFGGGVEWIQCLAGVPAEDYAQALLPRFKPKPDFAREWARLARTAGCRYVVFTSKHHEGFALHDSTVTEFDARDVTGRDLFREIVESIRAEGLKVGVYHSVIDWHHPHAYVGMGLPSIRGTTNEGRNNDLYVNYLHEQVREIVSGYGPIDILWWDYSSPAVQGEKWRARELISTVRRHQPDIIMNNRLYAKTQAGFYHLDQADREKGDFVTPEQFIPSTGLASVDWETCMTMNGTWGYSAHDLNWKPAGKLIRNLVDIASKGGNYLLNIGPMADGSVPRASVERMEMIGEWMRVHGASIYGTTASLFETLPRGRSTTRTQPDGTTTLYLHVFDWPRDGHLPVSGLATKPQAAVLLTGEGPRPVGFHRTPTRLTLELPAAPPHPEVSVVQLDFDETPVITLHRVHPSPDGSLVLPAAEARLHGKTIRLEQKSDELHNIGYWLDGSDYVEFNIQVIKPGAYRVVAEYACHTPSAGSEVVFGSGAPSEIRFKVKGTGQWQNFRDETWGTLQFPEPGEYDLLLRALSQSGEAVMNLRKIVLDPVRGNR